MDGIATKVLGWQRALLSSGLLIAAALTITNSSLDKVLVESCDSTDCPLRLTSTMPSAQAMQSGAPSTVTGAYTTPNTGVCLCNRPMERAEPLSPLRKSAVPSFGSTTQHHG
ncbi:hypothetical protein D3C75_1081520 [compost metagenome]